VDIDLYNEPVPLPRGGVRFPFELTPPPGFQVDQQATWPRVSGKLEYVGGRLLYMPPCGDRQGKVAVSVIWELGPWSEAHPEFDVAGNEIGMVLGGEVRAADAAIWRRSDIKEDTGGFRRAPPVLAIEVAGRDEGEPELREKARWYLGHGAHAVWVVLPQSREVVVIHATSERRYPSGEQIAADPELPGLTPQVARFFRQLL
jgi:Uma2 family endonuclease